MKKHKHFFLTIGGTLLLTGVVVTTLTTTILTSQKNQRWSINPFQNYNFQQAEDSLLKADVPADLVDQYLTLSKKITGVIKTDETIKSSTLLTLDDAIINSISQQMIWNNESSEQVQNKIDLVKPVLMQFYEYYDQVYVPQHHLETDILNAMQLESSNTDLYKWSIGTNLSDYGLIRNYLASAQEAWISKMSLSYILKTFLNKKIVLYNSLNQEATDGISVINQEIKELLNDKSALLNEKVATQNQKVVLSNMSSSINSWRKKLIALYSSTMAASLAQLSMEWFPPVAIALAFSALALGISYTVIQDKTNEDLERQAKNIQNDLDGLDIFNHTLEAAFSLVRESILKAVSEAARTAIEITGWVMSFIGMAAFSANFAIEKIMLDNFQEKIASSGSVTSNAINAHINDLDNQMNDISSTIVTLNLKENDYMQQKTTFNTKLNELIDDQQFFRSFDSMNDTTFVQTNFFTPNQIQIWQKAVESKYGYLTENSTTTDDFITAFANEKNNFNDKYQNIQDNKRLFMNNYNNNDKEYFIRNLLVCIDNPLRNDLIYFNNLDSTWTNYDDVFKK